MKYFFVYILIITNALAIKGVYTSDPEKVPDQACFISFKSKTTLENIEKNNIPNCDGVWCPNGCSGTYIGGVHLLTAKHCVESLESSKDAYVKCPNGEKVEIVENISPSNGVFEKNRDVGLLKLKNELSIAGMPIVENEDELDELMKTPENCYMAGYGLDNDNNWGKLLVAQTDKVKIDNVRYNWNIARHMMRLTGNYADHGDSGGTYYCEKDGKKILVGTFHGRGRFEEGVLVEKLHSIKPWVDYRTSPFGELDDDTFKSQKNIIDVCEGLQDCIVDLKELQSLGEDVSLILQKMIKIKKENKIYIFQNEYTEADKFAEAVKELDRSWRDAWIECDDIRDPLRKKHGLELH